MLELLVESPLTGQELRPTKCIPLFRRTEELAAGSEVLDGNGDRGYRLLDGAPRPRLLPAGDAHRRLVDSPERLFDTLGHRRS